MLVNIDISATVFYKEQDVISFLSEVVGKMSRSFDLRKPLKDNERVAFQREIKGIF